MTEVLTGGCLCGRVRYEYTGEPEGATYCHCPDCRRTTGGAFNVGVRMRTAGLKIVSGSVKGYAKTGSSGNLITREFCPECGSPLFTRSAAHPQLVFVKAGSIDDPAKVKPTHQIWTEMAVPWSHIPDNLPGYPKSGPVPEGNPL
jgi:hypothetical protein